MTSSKWRETFKVHPAADVFPMLSGEELEKLGNDIKVNGVRTPIQYIFDRNRKKRILIDGRNRLEAAERAGVELQEHEARCVGQEPFDVARWVISLNVHRRHLTKQQQGDMIVAVQKASRQVGEVPRHVKGKAGSEKDAVKAAAVAEGERHGISKRTMERSLENAARDQGVWYDADGKPHLPAMQPRKPRPKGKKSITDVENALSLIRKMTPAQRNQFEVSYAAWCERIGLKRTRPSQLAKIIRLIASTNAGERAAAIAAANRQLETMGVELVMKRRSTLLQDGRTEDGLGDPTPENEPLNGAYPEMPGFLKRKAS